MKKNQLRGSRFPNSQARRSKHPKLWHPGVATISRHASTQSHVPRCQMTSTLPGSVVHSCRRNPQAACLQKTPKRRLLLLHDRAPTQPWQQLQVLATRTRPGSSIKATTKRVWVSHHLFLRPGFSSQAYYRCWWAFQEPTALHCLCTLHPSAK